MRFVSSFLPNAAIEVAVCSKYSLEVVIVLTPEKLLSKAGFAPSVSSFGSNYFRLKFRTKIKANKFAYYWPKIFLSFCCPSDNFWLWKLKS